jgi:hypothetical protein
MFLADTLILYVPDSLNRVFLNLQTKIRRSREAASIGAGALRAKGPLFCAARVRASILRRLHDILLRWFAARARACGIGGVFDVRILSCSATRSYTPASWKFSNGIDLRTARVRIITLSVVVFGVRVSRKAGSGAADLRRGFFDMASPRAARIKTSSLGGGFLCGIFKGGAGFGTAVLDRWSRGGRGLRAARTGGRLVLCWSSFARLRALALDGELLGELVLRTKRDNAGIRGQLLDRPNSFTKAPSQTETVLRRLVLGEGAVAAAGIQ